MNSDNYPILKAPYPFPAIACTNDTRWFGPSPAFERCKDIYASIMSAQHQMNTSGCHGFNLASPLDSLDHRISDFAAEEDVSTELLVSSEWQERLMETAERMKQRKRRRYSS